MTVTTQGRQQTQLGTSVQRRQQQEVKSLSTGSMVAPSLKASLIGGFGIFILMLIGLIPPPENLPFVSLAFLVVPGYIVVCLATGLLAGIFAGDSIQNSQQGGKVGWMAGFWAGVFGGVLAMFLAAIGVLLGSFGESIVAQVAPETITQLAGYGLSAGNIALAGRVFGALIIYGLIGSLVSGLIASVGGMIYPKLNH